MGPRAPDWSHEETLLLVQMKKKAVLSNKNEGGRVWTCISNALSTHFDRVRSDHQCQQRWDTLKKVYKKIESLCAGGREDAHRDLGPEILAQMELATAYREDWYTILKQVCLAEEDRRHKKRKRLPRDNPPVIHHPPPINNNNNPATPDQAIMPAAPNASWPATADAQSSATGVEEHNKRRIERLEALLMPLLRLENTVSNERRIERLEAIVMELLQQQQNPQAHQMMQWPLDQLEMKPGRNFNMPLGDSAGEGSGEEDIELPSKCFSPDPLLPSLDEILDQNVCRIIVQFWGKHDSSDSAANWSTNPVLFGRQSMPPSSSAYGDERETTLTNNERFTTQMDSSSNQVIPRTLHPNHEKPASISLHISAETNVVAKYHELLAKLQRLKEEQQQQHMWSIQQSQVPKPVTASLELVSDEKPFNPLCAETNEPTTDALTESLAQMSLSFSELFADPAASQSMGSPKSTLIPTTTVDSLSPASKTDHCIHKPPATMVSKACASHGWRVLQIFMKAFFHFNSSLSSTRQQFPLIAEEKSGATIIENDNAQNWTTTVLELESGWQMISITPRVG